MNDISTLMQMRPLPATAGASRAALSANPFGIDAAAKEFEAMFLSQMLGHMFSDVSLDPMSEGSAGEDIYKSWMVKEYGDIITRAGGIGIADYVKRELMKAQEMPSIPAVSP